MSEPSIRPASAEDIAAFYGRPPQRSIRAFVAVLDNVPVAVAGIAYQGIRGAPYLFSDMRPEMGRYRKAVVRGARAVLLALARPGMPASSSTPAAVRFLKRLGFVELHQQNGETLMIYRGIVEAKLPRHNAASRPFDYGIYRSTTTMNSPDTSPTNLACGSPA
jgi:hypothetical protein